MPRHGRYPDSLRREAVRLVRDHGHEYRSQWEAICSVAERLGPTAETVRGWVRRDEAQRRVAAGDGAPATPGEAERRIGELEREVRELRRANAVLRAASALFARELDVELPE